MILPHHFQVSNFYVLNKLGYCGAVFDQLLIVFISHQVGRIIPVTLWLFHIAMEAMAHRFIDGLPIKNGDFLWLC